MTILIEAWRRQAAIVVRATSYEDVGVASLEPAKVTLRAPAVARSWATRARNSGSSSAATFGRGTCACLDERCAPPVKV